jgi:hypothetical protein
VKAMIRTCALAALVWFSAAVSAHAQAQVLLVPEAAEAVEGFFARQFLGGVARGAGEAVGSAAVGAAIDSYRNRARAQPYNSGNYAPPRQYAPAQQYSAPQNDSPPVYQRQCWTEYRRVLVDRQFDHQEFAGQWRRPDGVIVTRWRNVIRNHWRVYPVTHCG